MQLKGLDIGIIIGYLVVVLAAGFIVSRRAGKTIDSYFLGGKSIPWYYLGIANASGMFDISGTIWLVTLFFMYGVKSTWIPWVWPTFNQIFLMIYLSVWLRRSNVMTGAEWIQIRFGKKLGAELSHISVVIFALVSVIGFQAYAFIGIGKFAQIFLPWDLSINTYAIILMGITALYTVCGGMYSVVVTDILQYILMTLASIFIAIIAMQRVSPDTLAAVVPENWYNLFFGWKLNMDWSGLIAGVNEKMASDGFSFFTIFFMIMLFKGVLVSMAGPAPNYDMQKILAARSPKEAALMSWFVSVVLNFPRYLMIAGIGVLGLVFFSGDINSMAAAGQSADFEQILPYVINNFLPVGLVGIVLAGLLAAFMSTFDGTVNCGASYMVNDIYKRYINPNASEKRYVFASYVSSIIIVVVGIIFGLKVASVDSVLKWIVAGLWGGYTAANVIKWHWWRFNGFGYFGGMITGIVASIVLPMLFPQPLLFGLERNLAMFPIILALSTAASIIISLLTEPDEEEVLKEFYRRVRPWGFWKPICDKVCAENPDFKPNTAFKRDMFNVVVGIIWQTSFVLIAIYLVLWRFQPLAICAAVLAVTSVILKFNWYNKLEEQ
ncbi:MAG: sodium:solute symporter family protein [Phycisphaerae bacterium]|jgi:Na+/proline symporter